MDLTTAELLESLRRQVEDLRERVNTLELRSWGYEEED